MPIEWLQPGEFLECPVLKPERHTDEQVWVQFIMMGDGVDPDALSAVTGAQPRRAALRGAPDGPVPQAKTGHWEIGFRVIGHDVDAAFGRLLDVLEPHAALLHGLPDARMRFSLFTVLTVRPEWLDELAPQTLSRMGAFGARLSLELTCGHCY